MSGKLSRKSKRGSKSLTLRDDDADDMMALNTAELSFGSATAYEIPLESPRRSMLVPSHTLYPPSAYTKQSEGVEMHSSKELAAEDESSFEPLEAADATSTPLFGIGSSRAVPIPVQQEAKSSVEMEFEKERALLTSKNPVGGVLWRMRSESAWSAEFSMMDENKHTITNVETGATILSVKSNSVWSGGYDIYLGALTDKNASVWAKFKPYSSTTKCATIEFPNTDDVPIHARTNAGSSRYRFYREEHSSDYYTFFNFDNDKNLKNLIADVNVATWTEAFKLLVQPGQESTNMLPTLLMSVMFLIRRAR